LSRIGRDVYISRFLIVRAVCSPELVEGSTAIYSVWHIPKIAAGAAIGRGLDASLK
jgi:hypothetical protein